MKPSQTQTFRAGRFHRSSTVKRLKNAALVTAALSTLPLNAYGNPQLEALAPQLDRWVDLCNDLEPVTRRIGAIDRQEVFDGLSVLQSGNLSSTLSHIHQDEACLSLSASAQSGKPALTLFAYISREDRERLGETRTTVLSTHYKTENMAKRLTRLGVDLGRQYMNPGELRRSVDPEMERMNRNRGLLMGAKDIMRSYTLTTPMACVISMEPQPISDYLAHQKPATWELVDRASQQALKATGDATEFWHEVAHCNLTETVNYLATSSASADTDTLSQMSSYSSNRKAELAECEGSPEADLFNAFSRNSEIQNTLLFGQQNPMSVAMPEGSDWYINLAIQGDLLEESLADRYAIHMTHERLGTGTTGCADRYQIQSPWYRLRLAWSVTDPMAAYMTWVTPWLSGLPEKDQHQVIIEAFRAAFVEAKRVLPEPVYQEVVSSRTKWGHRYTLKDPIGTPNDERVQSWAAWIRSQLEKPGIIPFKG